jgi:hypothetical protein
MAITPLGDGAVRFAQGAAAGRSWMLHAAIDGVVAGAKTRNLTSLALARLALLVSICRTKAGKAIRGCTYFGYERAVDRMPAKSQ